jgi:formylglycine-generating enzyme required for sulfatase activity
LGDIVTFGSGVNSFSMEFVPIDNPGNPADTTGVPNPAGSVDYSYKMGKFEISEEMINKANLLGGLGILKDNRGINLPATGVSWNEAARFVNWLNTSQGYSPAYKFTTQPGDIGYSANANLSLWTSGDAGYNVANPFRNTQAHYFLPSADEWYKAAYYSPAGVYFDYPTGSDTAPTPVASGTTPGTAVYFGQGGPADVTLAGGLSPYGTMGQGGNVHEWEETEVDLINDSGASARGVRGGDWGLFIGYLTSSGRSFGDPTYEAGWVGFRVAGVLSVSVPESNSVFFGSLIAIGVLLWRRAAS